MTKAACPTTFFTSFSQLKMPDRLTIDTIDAELAPGARNAVSVCLQLTPEERGTIITDEATRDIAAALRAEVEAIGSEHSVFILENYASRPLTAMPRIILDDLAQSQVSIFAAQSQPGELAARREMTAVVDHPGIRHGHMVNISPQIMREGMRADFKAVDALSQRLIERARHAERITCRTPHGTEFEGEFSPKLKWLKTSGIITAASTATCRTPRSQSKSATIALSILPAKTKSCWRNFALTRAPTKTAIVSANLPSAPTPPVRVSSATFCRTKKFRASISPLAIPMPSTPAPIGFRKRTSTVSGAISTSGSTTNK